MNFTSSCNTFHIYFLKTALEEDFHRLKQERAFCEILDFPVIFVLTMEDEALRKQTSRVQNSSSVSWRYKQTLGGIVDASRDKIIKE